MRTALRVRLLGPLDVEGALLAPVPQGKAQRALAVLAERSGEFVPTGSLIDALWEADPPERAARNVAALVSRLRRALGRAAIDGSAAGYRLVPEIVDVDVCEAVDLLETAEYELAHGHFGIAAAGAEQAVKLLGADTALAGERDDTWVRGLRDAVDRYLRRARICWSTAALELRADDIAAEVAGAALRDDPLDEEACRLAMLGHQRAGRSGAALVAYRSLRGALAEHLGSDPSPRTQSVFLSVMRAENAAPAAERLSTGAVTTAETEVGAPAGAPLVGRDEELATLRRRWAAAAAGTPSMTVLTAEIGMGRTTLVDAFAEEPRRTGGLVVRVGCFEAERTLYLQPLVEAVRSVVDRLTAADVRELAGTRIGTLAGLLPELVDVVGPVTYEPAGPELEHRRSLDALGGFLVRLSARRPLLLVIEDLEHAGQQTIEGLHLLAGRWHGSRIMVLLTERSSEDPLVTAPLRDSAEWLALGPLGPEAVAELVDRSGTGQDPAQLHAWTGGSPLFLTELLRHPGLAGGDDHPTVPPSLREAVAERITHAGPEVSLLLGHGAVLGTTFALDDVSALSGIDVEEAAEGAGRALRAGLLAAQGEYFRFANDVVRQVAYQSVPEPVRISRHRRIAALWEGRPEAAARHLVSAGDMRGAATAWLAAADAAHLAFAHTDAVHVLGLAVEAARAGRDEQQIITALLRRGQALSDLGRYDEARADHDAALALARDIGDFELEARALEQLGWTALYARDALVAVEFAEQATELAESAAAAPGALPTATLLLGRVRHWDGDYEGAGRAYERVLATDPGDTTTALALAYRGALLQHQDRFAEARGVLARAVVLCRRTAEFRPLLQTLFFTALARGDSGDLAGALRALDSARRLIDAEKLEFYRAGIETTTSWLWQELGQVQRAREHAEHGVELARKGGGALELEQELHAQLALADCDLMLGRPDDAAAAVGEAAPMLDRPLPFRPRAAMRLLEMRARWEPSVAEALLDEARRFSSPKYQALALSHLGRPEDAARVAASVGSDLLVAQVGTHADRRRALDRMAASLPTDVRAGFVADGRLTVRLEAGR